MSFAVSTPEIEEALTRLEPWFATAANAAAAHLMTSS
jgi:hypothetical protein